MISTVIREISVQVKDRSKNCVARIRLLALTHRFLKSIKNPRLQATDQKGHEWQIQCSLNPCISGNITLFQSTKWTSITAYFKGFRRIGSNWNIQSHVAGVTLSGKKGFHDLGNGCNLNVSSFWVCFATAFLVNCLCGQWVHTLSHSLIWLWKWLKTSSDFNETRASKSFEPVIFRNFVQESVYTTFSVPTKIGAKQIHCSELCRGCAAPAETDRKIRAAWSSLREVSCARRGLSCHFQFNERISIIIIKAAHPLKMADSYWKLELPTQ